jgi:caa(3)-type oxidase subunit IV
MNDVRDERGEAEHASTSGIPFVLALVGLLALTALSFGLHFVPLGAAGAAMALSIATAKIAIVGTVFMELRESMAATRMIALVTVAFVALLCLGIAGDVAFR